MGHLPPMDIRNLLTSLYKILSVESDCIYHSNSDMDFPVTFLTGAAANELLLSSEHCYGLVGINTWRSSVVTHTSVKEQLRNATVHCCHIEQDASKYPIQ